MATLQKRRTTGPILDSRTVDNPNAPKHNTLNSPRGAALEQAETVLVEDPGKPDHTPTIGRSGTLPLRSNFHVQDYTNRGSIITPLEYFTPTDGETVTASRSSPGVILNPEEDVHSLTIVLPLAPVNGQRFSVHTTKNVGDLTVEGDFAPGNEAPESVNAGKPLKWIYSSELEGWLN